jgi:hypothetical protein
MAESSLYVVRVWHDITDFRASVRDVSRDTTAIVSSSAELTRLLCTRPSELGDDKSPAELAPKAPPS